MGMIPYYMFVERDTGPQGYFAVPLVRAAQIFRDAYSSVSGLGRTVRGPSMSATPGKVCIDGIAEIAGERVLAMHMIQARDPALVGRPFFARYDPDAVWLTDLEPAFNSRFPWDQLPADPPGPAGAAPARARRKDGRPLRGGPGDRHGPADPGGASAADRTDTWKSSRIWSTVEGGHPGGCGEPQSRGDELPGVGAAGPAGCRGGEGGLACGAAAPGALTELTPGT
jgi:hypothetical protein